MAQDDQYNKKMNIKPNDWESEDDDAQGEEGGSQQGGKSGQVEFRDFLSTGGELRDDLLNADERKRLLSVHKDSHEIRVKKQKDLREQRNDVKEGKVPLQAYQKGLMGAGMNSEYKVNPILADKAQFSGIDRQVNALPTENIADTNEADRNEPENQYRLRYMPEYAPRFNPKPQYNK